LAVLFMARREGDRWSRAITLAAGAATLMGVATYAAGMALSERSGGATGVPGQWKLLQLYDIVGEVKRDPGLPLRELGRDNPNLEKLVRSDATRLYTPARNDTLAASAALQKAFVATTPTTIAAQWDATLLSHPLTYLAVRANVFSWLFFTPDPLQCDAYYTGLNGPSQFLRELGLARRFRAQDRILANYAAQFTRTPVFSHAAYAALAVILIVVLILRRRTADLAMAALLGSALAFALSFFAIAIACDYRYLFFLDLASLTCGFYCAVTSLPVKNSNE
jgi:hypothetical protein